jgi:Protein of unknown function (DUF3631)
VQSGWNDGKGISTRELGRRLKPYSIRANTVRIAGVKAGNGYRREQFLDAWGRYLQAQPARTCRHSVTLGCLFCDEVPANGGDGRHEAHVWD